MSNWVTSRAAPEAIRVLSTLPRGAQDRILASTPRSKYPIQGIQLAPCCSLSSPYGPVATRCCAPVLRGGLLYGWVLEVAHRGGRGSRYSGCRRRQGQRGRFVARSGPDGGVQAVPGNRRHGEDRRVYQGNQGRCRRSSRSEEHTSELQSHSFISYALFC